MIYGSKISIDTVLLCIRFLEDYRSFLYLCPVFVLVIFVLSKGYNKAVVDTNEQGEERFSDRFGTSIGLDPRCSWRFVKYVPSAWEKYWFSNIDQFQYEVCAVLARADQFNRSIELLRRIMFLQQTTFDGRTSQSSVDDHLSQMHYGRTCSNAEQTAIQLIEPLIGLIRDPLTMCPRRLGVPSDLEIAGEEALQSKRHLLLAPSSPSRLDPAFPSPTSPPLSPWLYRAGARKILVDIGSSYFKSRNGNTAEIGTRWFYDYFSNRSITFDRIIAFEHQPLDTRRVWEELPEDVFPIYTFINLGIEATVKNRFNPWQMLERIAHVDDYVVVKLDIDKPVLENALMKQLTDDSSGARRVIDEMFFEKHVSEDRNSKDEKLKDSYELFTKLRAGGMRTHGWP